ANVGPEVLGKAPQHVPLRIHCCARPQNLSHQLWEHHHLETLVRRTETVKVVPRQGRQIARVGDVEDAFRPARIGRVPERSGLSRAGMTLEQPHALPRLRKPRLRRRPWGRPVLLAAHFGNTHRQVMLSQRLRGEKGMIVMMTNRSDEYRAFGTFGKSVTFPKRSGVLRRPPEIEVAALAATQARAAPAPV